MIPEALSRRERERETKTEGERQRERDRRRETETERQREREEVQDHLDEEHYLEVRAPFLTTGPSLDTLEALFSLSTAEAPFGGH